MGEEKRSSVFRSLRHRNARLYFVGLGVSTVGTWMQGTALAWLVLELTGSGTALGVVAALQFLPLLLLGAWAGALADRVERRRLLYVTQTLAAVQALVLGVAVLGGWVSVPLVYALTVVLGIVTAIDTPVRRSFIGDLVEHDDLQNAMSLNTAVMTGSRVAGPALAGVAIAAVGTGWCFVANGVSFAALLGALAAMDRAQIHQAPPVARAPGQVREGLRYAAANPVLRITLVTLLVVSTFTFNHQVTIPLMVERELGGGAVAFGVLLAVASLGSLGGAFVSAARTEATVRFYLVSLGVLALFMALLAVAPTFWVALVIAAPMGAGGAAFIAASSGLLVSAAAPELRGRILGLQTLAFLGSTPIGGPIVGWVGQVAGARWSVGAGAVVAFATLGFAWAADRRRLRSAAAA